jgi:hypothetical protein
MAKKKQAQTPKQAEQKLSRFSVQFDFDYNGSPGKQMDPKSQTVPDMSLTVRQLLQNHVRGVDSNVQQKNPLYFETQIPTIRDITDVQEYRETLEQKIKDMDEFLRQEKNKADQDSSQLEIPTDETEDIKEEKPSP